MTRRLLAVIFVLVATVAFSQLYEGRGGKMISDDLRPYRFERQRPTPPPPPPSPILETLQIGNMAYLDIYRDGSGVIKGSNTLYSNASISSILEEAGYDNYITSLEVGEDILPVSGLGGSCFLPFGNKLESIHLTSSVLNNAQMLFASLTTVKTITIDAVTSEIPGNFCLGCSALETISIPNWTSGVVSGFAFQGAPNLQTFIPASEYGTQAYYQSGIESVVLPSGCILGNSAFANCHNLTSLTCQGDTSTNTGSAFSGTSLAAITVYATGSPVIWTVDSNKVITADNTSKTLYPNLCLTLTNSGYTFYEPVSENLAYTLTPDRTGYYVSGLGSHTADLVINVPAEHNGLPVLGIGDSAIPPFGTSTVFKEFNFLGNITRLGSHAFQGSTNLERVTGLDSVTYIGSYCFNNCSSLEELVLPTNTPLTIETYAFNMLSPKITSFTIPENVVSLGEKAVCASDYLTELNILCPPTAMTKTVVTECPNVVVKLNAKYFLDWIYAPNGYDSKDYATVPEFAKDYVDIQLTNFSSGFLLDSDNKIKRILNLTSDEIYVPAVVDGKTVTGIKNGALRDLGVTKILIDNSNALDIEDYAVGNASLTEIIFTGNIPPTIASHSFVASATATTFFPYYNDYKDTNRADIQVNTAWVNLYKDSLAAFGVYRKMLGYGGYKYFKTKTAYNDGFQFSGSVTPERQYYWITPSWNKKPVRRIGGSGGDTIGGWYYNTCHVVIKKVFFPEGITTIGGVLFQANSKMEAPMQWPESLTSFGYTNQYDRTHVPNFAFPPKIHTIPDGFCCSCASLTAVVIPAHITRIGNQSFGRLQKTGSWPDSGIKEITFEGAPPATIHADAFYSVTDATIYYPSEYSEEWGAYTGTTSFKGATNVTWVAQ